MSFDLPELPGDEKQVKAIESKLTNNLTALRDELTNTKDFKTAVSKLKQLNKYYTNSDETQSYRSNYDAYQKWKEERRKLVEKGDLSEEDYKKEVGVTLGEFNNKGGTNYDPKTGEYNSINLVRSPHNMDKEIQEWALKYAKADKSNKKYMLELANISDSDKQEIIDYTLKYNKPEEIAAAVKAALMGSDRFKEYLDSKADLDYRYNKLADSDWSPNLKDAELKELDKNITNIQEIARGVDNSAAELVFLKKAIGTGATDITPEALDKLEKDFITKYGATPEEVLTAEKYHEKQKEDFLNNYNKNPDGVEQELFKDYYYQKRIQSEANAMGELLGFSEEAASLFKNSGSSKDKKNPLQNTTGGTQFVESAIVGSSNFSTLNSRLEYANNQETSTINSLLKSKKIGDTDPGVALLSDIISKNLIGGDNQEIITDEDGNTQNKIATTYLQNSPAEAGRELLTIMNTYAALKNKYDNVSSAEAIEEFNNNLEASAIIVKNPQDLISRLNGATPIELSKIVEKLNSLESIERSKLDLDNMRKNIRDHFWESEYGKKFKNALKNNNPFSHTSVNARGEIVGDIANMEERTYENIEGTVFDPKFWKSAGRSINPGLHDVSQIEQHWYNSLPFGGKPIWKFEAGTLDYLAVARLAGYDDIQDAVDKGWDWKTVNADVCAKDGSCIEETITAKSPSLKADEILKDMNIPESHWEGIKKLTDNVSTQHSYDKYRMATTLKGTGNLSNILGVPF